MQEYSVSQEGDPNHPPEYLSRMDYCIGLTVVLLNVS